MKKQVSLLAVLLGVCLIMTGCKTENSIQNQQSNQIEESKQTIMLEEDVDNTNTLSTTEIVLEDEDILDITEKMYVTYINEIYTNTEAYEGKKIKLEGMFTSAYDESTKQTYYFVYRTGPGCCNNDGSMCGFEFTTTDTIPVENDWIEVVGTLESYEENGYTYLNLRDASVTIKEERGQEVVYQ